jgi:hypothetical protein
MLFGVSQDDVEAAAIKITMLLKFGDVEHAFGELAQFVGGDEKRVAATAKSIGADPDVIDQMLATLGSGETIKVSSKFTLKPMIGGLRWSLVLAGVVGLSLGVLVRSRL